MLSYRFYRELRPALEFDRAAAKAIFRASRYTVPSGVLTLALTQFDKVVLLRLFGLRSWVCTAWQQTSRARSNR